MLGKSEWVVYLLSRLTGLTTHRNLDLSRDQQFVDDNSSFVPDINENIR